MTSDLLRRAVMSRRSLLGGLAAAGGAAALRAPDTPDDIAAAARLLDVSLSDAEREQAVRRMDSLRDDYRALREAPVELQTPPALRFDPHAGARPAAAARVPVVWLPPTELPALTTDEDLAFATVEQLAALLRQGRVTSRRLTELSLARLRAHGPKLFCVVDLLAEQALAEADKADAEIAAGNLRGPLHGIPYGAKDLLATRTGLTTYGAKPFAEQRLDHDASVIQRLRAAGAVLVAKLSLGALAMGDVWFGGKTRNPWNPEQGSSGSSAGSAAAVVAGLVPFAIGSETYGSIVSPCTRCGATGLRPTFGTVSRFGALPLSWTMDKLGPIARSAADCALVFDAIRGADPLGAGGRDADAVDAPFGWRKDRGLDGLRIGYLKTRAWQRPMEAAFLEHLRAAGVEPVELELPPAPTGAMLCILMAEAATALNELVRDGRMRTLVSQDDGSWPNLLRCALFTPAPDYLRAQRLRTQLIEDTAVALREVDVVVSPPFGTPALAVTNFTGHPCAVLPLGFRDNGTPTSITMFGHLYREADVLAVAEHWQTHTDWHRRRPALA